MPYWVIVIIVILFARLGIRLLFMWEKLKNEKSINKKTKE